ncbi:MAG: response regulator [Desulfobulbaceae bacterium]|nr:response regulator [Desulfobulbaceae bacterium]
MNKVLIVDDSQELLRPIVVGLQKYKAEFEILTAANGEEAVAVLKKEPISTLVTDLYMPKMDGLELLAYMTQNHPRIPCVVMTAFGSAEIQAILDQRGIFHYLEKPINLKDLGNTILDALAQFEQGKSLDGLSIAGFLQLIEMEQKSCIIEAANPRKESGRFFFVKGKLYNAEYNDLNADKAATTMLGWANAKFRVKSLAGEPEKRIGFGLKTLIMESARLQDEIGHTDTATQEQIDSKTTTADLMYQAIRRAEANEDKMAQQMLATILKQNPRNPDAWLWYSRVTNNVKAIEAALENATILAKDNPEIIEEAKKLQQAFASGCPKTGEITHCPFCWTPYVGKPDVCPYCKAYFLISPSMLKDQKKGVNTDLINKAIHRYTRIILVEKKQQVHFNLALAHLNRNQWEEGLDQLYKTKTMAPDNKLYRQQLNLLLDHMANIELPMSGETAKPAMTRTTAAEENRRNKTVLVVEDSATTRKVITVILKHEGFDVVEAKDGIEALARFNEIVPDLVLLDIIMPGMDGYQVLATMKNNANFKKIPVIMLTAKDGLIDKVKGKMSGCSEYLTKPFTPEELMARIKKYLR